MAEVAPLSKDLAALGEAGIRLLDYLAPRPPAEPADRKKLSAKARKAEEAARKAEQASKAEWLAKENAELARLAQTPRRPPPGGPDVRLAAYRPVKVLADAVAGK